MTLRQKLEERLVRGLSNAIQESILEHIDFEVVVDRCVEELLDTGTVSGGYGGRNFMEDAAKRIEEQLVEELTSDLDVDAIVDEIDVGDLLEADSSSVYF